MLIIGICIHNEVIIINKWRLNEYTKDKITKKSDEDYQDLVDISGNIEEKSNDDSSNNAE